MPTLTTRATSTTRAPRLSTTGGAAFCRVWQIATLTRAHHRRENVYMTNQWKYGYRIELNPETFVWEILCADGGVFRCSSLNDAEARFARLIDQR